MDDKTARLAEQLKKNPAMLRSLMQSRDGQQLMQMLTKNDRGSGLQRAVQAAAKGNSSELTAMVQQIMSSSEGAALIDRIQKAVQK